MSRFAPSDISRIIQHQDDSRSASRSAIFLLVEHTGYVDSLIDDDMVTREKANDVIVKFQRKSAEESAQARRLMFGEE